MKKYITFIMITVTLSFTLIACNDTDNANNNNNIVAENNDLLENDSDNSEDIENNLEDEDIFADESEDNQEEVTNEDDMKSKMEEFGFEYLELDYEFEFEKPYKAKVEIDEDGEVLAELDDDEADEHLKGPEAFNAIFEDYSGAFNNDYETKDVSYSTEDQQVVEGASGAFYINSAFSNGKVKIKYDNGKEINAEHSRD